MLKGRKLIIGVLILIVTVLLSSFIYIYYNFRKYSYVDPEKKNNISYKEKNNNEIESNKVQQQENKQNEQEIKEPSYKEIEGITNILLIGTDARELEEVSRSDTMMILTLDDIHKKIKLTSIMRDTYAEIPGYGEEKINHSFAYGGPDLLMKTIERNFEVKINNYVIVNFYGFKDLIDAIGGLDIDLKPEEVQELNRCALGLEEQRKNFFGAKPHLVEKPGLQHFDGEQVLNYARMRKIGKGCYDRTQRQRFVVDLMINKMKDTSLIKYPNVITKLMACVKTNVDFTDAINLAYTGYKINNFNLEQLQIPVNKLSYNKLYKNKGWVILTDKKQNKKVIQEFIFDDIALDESKYKYFSYVNSEYYYEEPKKQQPEKKQEEIDELQKCLNNKTIDKELDIENGDNSGDMEEINNEDDILEGLDEIIGGEEVNLDIEESIDNEEEENKEAKTEEENKNIDKIEELEDEEVNVQTETLTEEKNTDDILEIEELTENENSDDKPKIEDLEEDNIDKKEENDSKVNNENEDSTEQNDDTDNEDNLDEQDSENKAKREGEYSSLFALLI